MLVLFLKKAQNDKVTFNRGDIAEIEPGERCGFPSFMISLKDEEDDKFKTAMSLYGCDTQELGAKHIMCSSIPAMRMILQAVMPNHKSLEKGAHIYTRRTFTDSGYEYPEEEKDEEGKVKVSL